MDCCCEMGCDETAPRRTAVSASQLLLEEKHRRAKRFGAYLEQHPIHSGTPLGEELLRATSIYRMAIHNVLQEMRKLEN